MSKDRSVHEQTALRTFVCKHTCAGPAGMRRNCQRLFAFFARTLSALLLLSGALEQRNGLERAKESVQSGSCCSGVSRRRMRDFPEFLASSPPSRSRLSGLSLGPVGDAWNLCSRAQFNRSKRVVNILL
jgi:hypothetical protein